MSRPLVIPSTSTEYILVRVHEVTQTTNPTTLTVSMAFMQGGVEPASGNWVTASWATDSSTPNPVYYAQCLVGPAGTITLPDGEWAVWVQLQDDPENVQRRPGRLIVS